MHVCMCVYVYVCVCVCVHIFQDLAMHRAEVYQSLVSGLCLMLTSMQWPLQWDDVIQKTTK